MAFSQISGLPYNQQESHGESRSNYDPPPEYNSIFHDNSAGKHLTPVQGTFPVSTQPMRNSDETGRSLVQENVSPGWQHLSTLDHLFVLQDDVPACAYTRNFTIKDQLNQTLYYASQVEDDCCGGLCKDPYKPFQMGIYDMSNNEIIRIFRSMECRCIVTSQSIEVSAPPGNVIGIVAHEIRFFRNNILNIMNSSGDIILKIKCPMMAGLPSYNDFEIISVIGNTPIGRISRISSDTMREMFFRLDCNFEIIFPRDLETNMKAIILAACFMIKCVFYERNNHHFVR